MKYRIRSMEVDAVQVRDIMFGHPDISEGIAKATKERRLVFFMNEGHAVLKTTGGDRRLELDDWLIDRDEWIEPVGRDEFHKRYRRVVPISISGIQEAIDNDPKTDSDIDMLEWAAKMVVFAITTEPVS